MKLASKLTLAVTCAILAVLATNSFIRVQRELALFDEDMRRDGRILGRAIAGDAERAWSRSGVIDAIDQVLGANEREAHVTIRWVWLDVPPGHPQAPMVPTVTELADDVPLVLEWTPPGEEDTLFSYFPIRGPDGRVAAVELRESRAAERRYIRRTVLQATLATSALVVLAGLVTLGLGMALVGRPVRQLVEHARKVGQGDLSARLALRQQDEIGTLAAEMNAMTERLGRARAELEAETQAKVSAVEQLRHADRLATIGRLSAGIAHEVGTPLNVITGYARLIVDDVPAASPAREHAEIIGQQAHRVAAIVRQLLDFARPRPPAKAHHELGAIVARTVGMLDSIARKRGVQLERPAAIGPAAPAPVEVEVDDGQLQQVITNLVVNAIHASAPGQTVEIGIERGVGAPPPGHGGAPGPRVCVCVRDHGTGMDPEVQARIFDPFFTTKDVGEGTGLGLSVAHGIVREHGGWIEVSSAPGQGSTFRVCLPVAEEGADA